ncbi:hypothetical protein GC093_02970 [Paenibacillus sp. LMG 31456]|uniref:Uncharacterized protein n=1 Tax=Paenibacillus foliorum TaxID=2654974 RepID=A0A972JX82_9BACL|nr:hypothetical protein [Paenibacillus foliorum]NOU92199.1 hypothetical protein [Paenibacillus foliorum]
MIPSVEQWKDLYAAAAEFKQVRCWEWLSNGHIFGVENPANGEIGYCCVMGNGGELYGLAVYLGTAGLETFVGMLTGELDEDPLYTQHCLMLSFDDRNELQSQELKQIKELGLSFRGAKSWPTFREYKPGFVPWPIENQEQVAFLTLALQQALEVANEYKSNPDALIEAEDETFLTRVAVNSDNGLVWSSEWILPRDIEDIPIPAADPVDELRIAKIKKNIQGSAGVWEMDCFFAPTPVKDGDRPYYPMMYMIVDQETGQILNIDLQEQSLMPNAAVASFLKLVEQKGMLPTEIWAVNEQVFMYLSQLLKIFNLQVYLTLELPAIEEAKEGMREFFQSGIR